MILSDTSTLTFLSTGQCHLVNAGNLLDISDCEVTTERQAKQLLYDKQM